MKYTGIFVLACLLLSANSFATKRYYSLSRSVRAHGMGGAFYGISDDEYALFYNPAGLGFYRGGGHFTLSTRAAVTVDTVSSLSTLTSSFSSGKTTTELVNSFLALQGKPLGGNISFMPSFVTKKFALGILLPDIKTDLSVLGAGLDTTFDVTVLADAGLLLAFAKTFMADTLSVGVTPKFVARVGGTKSFPALDIVQGDTAGLDVNSIGGAGAGFDFDVGATYRLTTIPFGVANRASLVLTNVLASSYPIGSTKGSSSAAGVPGLTRMVSLGWFTAFSGVSVIDNFNLVADLAEFGIGGESDPDRGGRGGSFWKHLNIGVEAPVRGWFIPRAGIHQGNVTAGFGVRARVLQLDYAWFGEELLGGVGRYTARTHEIRVAIGYGAAAPAPIVFERLESKPEGFEKPVPIPTPAPQKLEQVPVPNKVQMPVQVPTPPTPPPPSVSPESAKDRVPQSVGRPRGKN